MRRIYTILVLVLLAVVAAVCFVGVRWWNDSPEAERVTLTPARISEVRPMVALSTVDIYEEMPLKGRIGKRHIVARVALEGSVSFDLEKIGLEDRGDTVVVTLPPATVTLRESTRPDSYRVIDTWNESFLGSANFTAAEENALKRRFMEAARRGVYRKGYVDEAENRARQSVERLLGASTGRPVEVRVGS